MFNPEKCMKVTALQDYCKVYINKTSGIDCSPYFLSKDGKEWSETIELSKGETAFVKGTQYYHNDASINTPSLFTFSVDVAISGHVTSLVDDGAGEVFPLKGGFCALFQGDPHVVSVSEDFLPATMLADRCYKLMFSGCTGLRTLPTHLLPATSLKKECYKDMFLGCTGLTRIPNHFLPAKVLTFGCYSQMFANCTNLKEIHIDFFKWADAVGATKNWLYHVASEGVIYAPEALERKTGPNYFPLNWIVCGPKTFLKPLGKGG